MKLHILTALALTIGLCGCTKQASKDPENKLVIIHTNDTHSQIDPEDSGLGGVMRRKAIIDSIRAAEENVLVVDAGDAVQGTLYFYLYGGRVEQEVLNHLGVDVRILGNHEFDNGIDSLASIWSLSQAEKISSNYDLSDTPLAGQVLPYTIREYGGKRIGIIGINLDPEGIITPGNYDGLQFKPIVATANLMAEMLKKEMLTDAIIALTHIGYNPRGLVGDSILAANSRNIDIIIGGHSHDTIDPSSEHGARRSRMRNLDGKEVLVVQTGKAGRRIGKIEINLDNLGLGGRHHYELIQVDNSFDNKIDSTLLGILQPYAAGVDSLMHLWVGRTANGISNDSHELLNFFSDFIYEEGLRMAPGVDLAIANKGGLRAPLPAGRVSKGHIINMVPFNNYIQVIDLSGRDLKDVFDVMAATDGNGISRNVTAKYERAEDDEPAEAEDILINGKPLDKDRVYRVATIDYLAKGGDYMRGLTRGTLVAASAEPVYHVLLEYLARNADKEIGGDPRPRWTLDD